MTLKIQPAVSLWNYTHYHHSFSLEEVLTQLQKHEYGVELWNSWTNDRDLFQPSSRERLKQALVDMPVSLHSQIGLQDWDSHQRQVDTAAEMGARVIVVHADNFFYDHRKELNLALMKRVVDYAEAREVLIALENGQLPILKQALQEVEGLKICLDTGHVYLTDDPMSAFLEELAPHVAHLHVQEILTAPERRLVGEAGIILDHYTPGTGGIPAEDWQLLFGTLREEGFRGMAVFEIQPRRPLQTALLAERFVNQLITKSR
jgi:sugar phosphate isomerase/epimerase